MAIDIDKLRERFEEWWSEDVFVPKVIDPPVERYPGDRVVSIKPIPLGLSEDTNRYLSYLKKNRELYFRQCLMSDFHNHRKRYKKGDRLLLKDGRRCVVIQESFDGFSDYRVDDGEAKYGIGKSLIDRCLGNTIAEGNNGRNKM